MSLATRCTACGTIFKVVQDQLKVSEGWVRCGRCQQVFNALEGLFDLERDPPPQRRMEGPATAPPEGTASGAETGRSVLDEPNTASEVAQPPGLGSGAHPPAREADAAPAVAAQASAATAHWAAEVPATHEDDALDSRWLVRPARDGRLARERHARHDPDSDFTDARFPNDAALDEPDDGSSDDDRPPAGEGPRPMPPIPAPTLPRTLLGRSRRNAAEDAPAFVKQAKRQAQWRHPVVRLTLGLTGLALLALLGLQAAVAFRDWIVAYQPASRPWLAALCSLSGCEVAPLRRIDRLAVDSVTLVRGRAGPDAAEPAYRLVVSMHNDAPVALAAPHLELSLTDADGQLVARRILTPRDVGLEGDTLRPEGSTTVQAGLQTVGPRIAGYTVELFYP